MIDLSIMMSLLSIAITLLHKEVKDDENGKVIFLLIATFVVLVFAISEAIIAYADLASS